MTSERPADMLASVRVPTEFGAPPSEDMKHSVTFNVPLPTELAAKQLYHVLRVDRELKPSQTFVSYRIDADKTPSVLDLRVQCCTVRQLRLSVNALLDNVSLVIATLEAFTPSDQRATNSADGQEAAGMVDNAPDEEYELSGTGRAG